METLELHNVADKKIYKEELILFIQNNLSGFILKTQYSYIGCCQSSIDVMQDHLEMAFILEKLLQFSSIIKYEKNHNTYPPEILITLLPNQNDCIKLTNELCFISLLKTSDTDPDEEELESLICEVDDFENNLERISFRFSDEIEDYYANYLNQGIYEIASQFTDNASEYLSSCYNKNPEWQYGFWRNHLLNIPSKSLYFSSFCWVIKSDVDENLILSEYSGIENFVFDDSFLINDILINDFTAIDYNSLYNLDMAISFIDSLTNTKGKKYSFGISRNFDIVRISYSGYIIIYFDFHILKEDVLKKLYVETIALQNKISVVLGFSHDISCDWKMITDETFEELCYEIIYNNIYFDNRTIRKMGKSKSRDGGRDIVIWTNPQSGDFAKKYIIQCKLLHKSTTLTKSMMGNVANVIMEYDADGYIVMTNVIIDGGLYDMLDGFSKNTRMLTFTHLNYSKLEIERYLDRNKLMKQRYFHNV